jgi:outer membrane protein assembly factor BamB
MPAVDATHRTSLARRAGRLLGALVVLSTAGNAARAQAPPAGDDWSQFRFGPRHLGVNPSENVLSAANVGGLVRKWSTPIGDTVFASPAVVDGRVYVGTLGGQLCALDADTGAVLWRRPVDALPGDTVWTSPAVANGVVYFAANRPWAVLYALDAATGATLWTASPTLSIIVASPTVANGVVYLAFNDHSIVAVDAQNGGTLWSADGGAGMYSSPAVADGRLYVAVHNRGLLALDAATGAELWLAPMSGPQWSSPAVGRGGVVYVGSRDDERLYAFAGATGAPVWSAPLGDWVHSSPAVTAGTVYAGANDGRLYALSARTGQQLWSTPLAPTGGIFSGPTVANGVVYTTSGQGDGKLYAVHAATGQVLFSAHVGDGDQAGDGEWVNASPAVANGTVYVGSYESEDSVVTAFGLPPSRTRRP